MDIKTIQERNLKRVENLKAKQKNGEVSYRLPVNSEKGSGFINVAVNLKDALKEIGIKNDVSEKVLNNDLDNTINFLNFNSVSTKVKQYDKEKTQQKGLNLNIKI